MGLQLTHADNKSFLSSPQTAFLRVHSVARTRHVPKLECSLFSAHLLTKNSHRIIYSAAKTCNMKEADDETHLTQNDLVLHQILRQKLISASPQREDFTLKRSPCHTPPRPAITWQGRDLVNDPAQHGLGVAHGSPLARS